MDREKIEEAVNILKKMGKENKIVMIDDYPFELKIFVDLAEKVLAGEYVRREDLQEDIKYIHDHLTGKNYERGCRTTSIEKLEAITARLTKSEVINE